MKAILVLCTILIAFCGKSVAVKFRKLLFRLFHKMHELKWFFLYPTAQEVPKCKKGDSACIVKSANAMIKNFAGGRLMCIC